MNRTSLFMLSAIVAFSTLTISASERSQDTLFIQFIRELPTLEKTELSDLLNDTESLEKVALYFKKDIEQLPPICPPEFTQLLNNLEKQDKNFIELVKKIIDIAL